VELEGRREAGAPKGMEAKASPNNKRIAVRGRAAG
jgi:hypothetical protein